MRDMIHGPDLTCYLFMKIKFYLTIVEPICFGLPWWLSRKESTCNAGDTRDVSLIPGLGSLQVQSLGLEDPLEKEMATHSSILAWKIPWTEEPGGLRSQRLSPGGWDRKDSDSAELTQKPICLLLSVVAVTFQRCNSIVASETGWSAVPKVFTLWHLTEKKCTSVPGQGKGLKSRDFLKFCTLATTLGWPSLSLFCWFQLPDRSCDFLGRDSISAWQPCRRTWGTPTTISSCLPSPHMALSTWKVQGLGAGI